MLRFLEKTKETKYHRKNFKRVELILFLAAITKKSNQMLSVKVKDLAALLEQAHMNYKRYDEQLGMIKKISRWLNTIILSFSILVYLLIWKILR